MNKPTRTPKASEVKITKKGVDAALAAGNTHAKFTNKGVQKRLMKNQAIIKRQQELKENMHRRQQKVLTGVMKNVAQSGAVVNQGVAALSQLVDAKANAAIAALTDPTSPDVRDAVLSISNESPDGLDDVDPASIGGDLIDVDYDPTNFGVQMVSPDVDAADVIVGESNIPGNLTNLAMPVLKGEDGLIYVKRFTALELTANRHPLNLYGDAQNYKPLPEIGDMVRPDGIVIGLRTYPVSNLVTEVDPAALAEVNYIFDTLRFAPAGEIVSITDEEIVIAPAKVEGQDPSEIKLRALTDVNVLDSSRGNASPSAEQLREHILNDDVKRSYPHVIEPMTPEHLNAFEVPHDSGRKQMFAGWQTKLPEHMIDKTALGDSIEAAMEKRPESFTDVPQKVQNSSLSGALLNPVAQEMLADKFRPGRVFDPLLQVTQEEVNNTGFKVVDVHAGNTVVPKVAEEGDKDEGAGDDSFSLKP